MSDLLMLPEPSRGLLNWMLRQGQVSSAEVAAFLGRDEAHTRATLAGLLDNGYVRELESRGGTQYRARLAPKRGRKSPPGLWEAISDKVEGEEDRR